MNNVSDDLLQTVGNKKFATVLADPPWQFTNRTGKMAPETKDSRATPPCHFKKSETYRSKLLLRILPISTYGFPMPYWRRGFRFWRIGDLRIRQILFGIKCGKMADRIEGASGSIFVMSQKCFFSASEARMPVHCNQEGPRKILLFLKNGSIAENLMNNTRS